MSKDDETNALNIKTGAVHIWGAEGSSTLCGYDDTKNRLVCTPKPVTCQACLKAKFGPEEEESEFGSAFDLASDIAGDESDGVFWGIVHELGGW